MAEPSKEGLWNNYEVKGDKLVRKNEWSPKLGPGYRMANHKDRKTCGKTGYTEFKTSTKKEEPEPKKEEEKKEEPEPEKDENKQAKDEPEETGGDEEESTADEGSSEEKEKEKE